MNTEGKTVGEILRAAREEKKLSLEQVNRETKMSAQTVRALEQDDFGAFSSETYLKGFLRTYAEFLGLDGNRLWAMIGPGSAQAGGASGPAWEIESAMREEKLGPPRWIRQILLPALVVAVIVLVVLLVRERRRSAAPVTGARDGAAGVSVAAR